MPVPAAVKIYHIVHVDKLPLIIADGYLWCDAEIVRRNAGGTTIGMRTIKQRRLGLPVTCHPGTFVGDYVPFYFCSQSVMLYLLYQGNHPELDYQGGQQPIVHLEADLEATIAWANGEGRRWAFSLSNAGAAYTQFRCGTAQLDEINWEAVAARDWRDENIKEGKQAEFLVHRSFAWNLISRVGVCSRPTYDQVQAALQKAGARVKVEIMPSWYY